MKQPLKPEEQAVLMFFVLGLICGTIITLVMMAGILAAT